MLQIEIAMIYGNRRLDKLSVFGPSTSNLIAKRANYEDMF